MGVRSNSTRAVRRPGRATAGQSLATWATRIAETWGRSADAYAYFNNDHRACALRDAATFARLVNESDLEPVRTIPIDDGVLVR